MQWTAFNKDLQARGMPVIVDLSPSELDEFIESMHPQGLFLWVSTTSEEEELAIIERLKRWM